jgi:DNA polymerase
MQTRHPSLDDCIESLRLHIRSLKRSGLRFAGAGISTRPTDQSSRAARLESLREQNADCKRCGLCTGRTNVVFGDGNSEARLMFVGDAPDRDSDAQGSCFAGESGHLLTRIIEAIKMQRSKVYLSSIVKCIVPQGEPGDDSIEACMPLLLQQIEIIQPDIICALGPVAARALQEPGLKGDPPRGEMFYRGHIPVMPTHHPELLLRRPELKQEAWIDVQVIQRELASGTRRKC